MFMDYTGEGILRCVLNSSLFGGRGGRDRGGGDGGGAEPFRITKN